MSVKLTSHTPGEWHQMGKKVKTESKKKKEERSKELPLGAGEKKWKKRKLKKQWKDPQCKQTASVFFPYYRYANTHYTHT